MDPFLLIILGILGVSAIEKAREGPSGLQYEQIVAEFLSFTDLSGLVTAMEAYRKLYSRSDMKRYDARGYWIAPSDPSRDRRVRAHVLHLGRPLLGAMLGTRTIEGARHEYLRIVANESEIFSRAALEDPRVADHIRALTAQTEGGQALLIAIDYDMSFDLTGRQIDSAVRVPTPGELKLADEYQEEMEELRLKQSLPVR